MTPLSVVIITWNEERNIERCLLSVQDVADDIVVLDSFSADKTCEICQKYNVRFIEHAFDGHIEQKNRAITHARYPHILSLDADEALSEELKKSIIEVKNNWLYDGYYFNRLNNYCGKWIRHGSWYPDRKLRLWNSLKGKWTGVNPHDKFEMNEDCTTKFLKGDLLHYTYASIEEHIRQLDKFSSIAARALLSQGKKTNLLKIIVKPCWKFIHSSFIKGGILDGYYGLIISFNDAFASYLKQVKMKEKK